jgi:hypothetical protein
MQKLGHFFFNKIKIFKKGAYQPTLKYKCTIMCNYLNNYNNLNGCSLRLVYIFMKNVQKKMYSLFVWYIFKTSAIQIHSIPIFLYPWLTGQEQTSRNLRRSCQSFGLTDMKILSVRKIFCRSEKKVPKNSLSHA